MRWLDQYVELNLYIATSPKQQSVDRYVAPFWHIILTLNQPFWYGYEKKVRKYN